MHSYLKTLLERRRPSGGDGVHITLSFITSVIESAGYGVTKDEFDNLVCTTEFTGTLFSCHTDTMHWREGVNEIRMDEFGIITAWTRESSTSITKEPRRDILGADDAAGIYIMLRMIEEGVPGTYVFHADEEIGCLGSQNIASNAYSIDGRDLGEFTHAIAFDRKGTSDFITNQLGEEMCSYKCCIELASRLNSGTSLCYRKADGVVTDTAMYSDYIQECINLSVGYYDEHTENERLDCTHVELLLKTILEDRELFVGLPVARNIDDYSEYTDSAKYTFVPDSSAIEDDTVASLILKHPREVAEVLEGFFGVDYEELFALLNKGE